MTTIYQELTGTDQPELILNKNELNCHKGFNDMVARTENFHILYELLVQSGMHWWLMFGTLLGAVREKDFIKWDADTDLSLPVTDKSKFVVFLREAIKKGFKVIRSQANDELVSIARKGEYIDFYFWAERKDYMEMCGLRIDKEHFKTLDTLDFLGHKCNVPYNYILLLVRLYGDWQIPKRDFTASREINYAGGKTYYEH